ncbi:YoaK family protein [Granulicella arctica]|uniref:Uncharacterized membrane protein YoaK (UPF0700 family) n=1 Tax=Granulicella arctica TaxID=940613 RepID=A0A7Y9TFM8_9BACT|nr:YoaK family protein [Granulicella arctica]NYF78504.1 uncharacterized membrane protein YoaK (UPF0700 family) [Granulicella arctica]
MTISTTPSADPTSEPLIAALLLATTGGMLDAFVYLNHGHVFANAMTGNVVLLGISIITRHGFQAIRHVIPLIAFLAGVTSSKLLRSRLGRRAGLAGLGLEFVALAAASFLPASFPQMAFTALIAFVASYQITSFRHVGTFPYNSTFVTGNLRMMIEGLYESTSPATRHDGFAKARDLGLICLCFFLGALFAAWLAPRFGNHTLWFTLPLLLIVAIAIAPAALTLPQPAESKTGANSSDIN